MYTVLTGDTLLCTPRASRGIDRSMAKTEPTIAEKEAIAELNLELDKARKAREERLQGWTALKDPGQLMAGSWEVGIIDSLTYNELHRVFGDAWVWGPNVRTMKAERSSMATQFGLVEPSGRQWSICAEWPRGREAAKDAPVNWYLSGTTSEFEAVGKWLANVAGRRVSITGTDADDIATFGVTYAFQPAKDQA